MSILIRAGKLISTSDLKLAVKLQQFVSIAEITGNATPQALRQSRDCISFMHRGEYYEIERASALDAHKLEYEQTPATA